MRALDFTPPDRSMTREQWKAVDRWLRIAGRKIMPVAIEAATIAVIYGTSALMVDVDGVPRAVAPGDPAFPIATVFPQS